ncbi:MAG: hypothetical protein KJP20_04740 [Bacteroidia bacterium]|nr:hypothetical protein [Bacteroidia bacterium]NND26530.1 hypothetical protein [Flavobacteriaceae bacterium]
MKTFKSIVLVAAIAFSTVLTANTNSTAEADPTVITTEVGKLLKNPSFLVDQDITANVTLTINKNNEIVVLSVDSEDSSVEDYIKARLNYNALPSSLQERGKTFIVPVRLHTELD